MYEINMCTIVFTFASYEILFWDIDSMELLSLFFFQIIILKVVLDFWITRCSSNINENKCKRKCKKWSTHEILYLGFRLHC